MTNAVFGAMCHIKCVGVTPSQYNELIGCVASWI